MLAHEAEERKRHREMVMEEKASFRLAAELQTRADAEARTEENALLEIRLEEIAVERRSVLGEEAISARKKEWEMEQRVREQKIEPKQTTGRVVVYSGKFSESGARDHL